MISALAILKPLNPFRAECKTRSGDVVGDVDFEDEADERAREERAEQRRLRRGRRRNKALETIRASATARTRKRNGGGGESDSTSAYTSKGDERGGSSYLHEHSQRSPSIHTSDFLSTSTSASASSLSPTPAYDSSGSSVRSSSRARQYLIKRGKREVDTESWYTSENDSKNQPLSSPVFSPLSSHLSAPTSSPSPNYTHEPKPKFRIARPSPSVESFTSASSVSPSQPTPQGEVGDNSHAYTSESSSLSPLSAK